MLSYLNWLNEDYTIKTEERSFNELVEYLMTFCIDPTSIFKRDIKNLDLYNIIYRINDLEELKSYLVWIKKGDYVDALIKWFSKITQKEKRKIFIEDYGVISETLQKYKQIRNKFRPMPDPETGELVDYSVYKNIMNFKSLDEFYTVMTIFEKEQTKAEKLREIKEDVLVVEYTDDLKILVPLTEEASKIYGKGTKWCTTADNNNQFVRYAEDGPLFILIKNGEKYQFHFESKSYMDAQDQEIYNYKKLFIKELNLIEDWRRDNLKIYFDIIEFSKKSIQINKDNIKYIKYLKYNKNIESIACYYLDQHIVDMLDSLNYDIFVYLESEDQYTDLNNRREYHIFYKDRFKYFLKDELQYNPDILFQMYYDVNGTYEIIDDKFYIKGYLELKKQCSKMPPIIIEEVSAYFDCSNNKLESLENGPKKVGGSYFSSGNKLKTLKGCAEIIGGYFNCYDNKLKSLDDGPYKIGGGYDCSYNKLETLKGCTQIIPNDFDCSHNQLETLEYGPKEVGKNYWCAYNQLISLKGCPTKIGGVFDCSHNKLTSLEYGPIDVVGNYSCHDNKIYLELPEDLQVGGVIYR